MQPQVIVWVQDPRSKSEFFDQNYCLSIYHRVKRTCSTTAMAYRHRIGNNIESNKSQTAACGCRVRQPRQQQQRTISCADFYIVGFTVSTVKP